MRVKVLRVRAACGLLALGAAWASGAGTARVDLSKPFEVDKDTIALYHLDDVARPGHCFRSSMGLGVFPCLVSDSDIHALPIENKTRLSAA